MVDAATFDDAPTTHATDIGVSYVASNSLGAKEVSTLLRNVYSTLADLGQESAAPEVRPEPAASVRSSIKRDHIVCLEDGKKMKVLTRHLMADRGMTPDEYRAR